MEEVSGVVAAAPSVPAHFLLRRLHSLLGLIPLGVFVVIHLVTNSTILFGGESFQTAVDQIHLLGKLGILIPLEIVGIFLPLAFHAGLGIQIWLSGEPNVVQYRYASNVRYYLQRVTGIIALLFILFHLWQMHWTGKPFGGGIFEPENAAASAADGFREWWVAPIYVIGVTAVVYHLANGIWTSLITWGITLGPRSQRVSGYACTAFGIILGLVGLGAVRGFRSFGGRATVPQPVRHTMNTEGSAATEWTDRLVQRSASLSLSDPPESPLSKGGLNGADLFDLCMDSHG